MSNSIDRKRNINVRNSFEALKLPPTIDENRSSIVLPYNNNGIQAPSETNTRRQSLPKYRNPSVTNRIFNSLSSIMSSCSNTRHLNSQIVPTIAPVDTDEDTSTFTAISRNISSRFITDKLSELMGATKVKDLFDFITNIEMDFSEEEYDINNTSNNSNRKNNFASISFVKYKSSIQYTSTHTQVTQFRRYLKRITFYEYTKIGYDDVTHWFALIDIVISFLDNIRKMEEGFFTSSKSAYGQSGLSLEGCLALTVSKLRCIFTYVT